MVQGFWRYFWVSGLVTAAGCVAPTSNVPPASTFQPAGPNYKQDVEIHFAELARLGYSGAAVVVKDGVTLLDAGSGMAGPNQPFTADMAFDVASITKPVTGMAVLRLIEQKKMSLDDPITRWFPDAPADKRQITVRQLVSHNSGIPDFLEGLSDYTPITADAMAAKLLASTLEFQPGAQTSDGLGPRSSYSNGGFVLLGILIELASGKSMHEFLETEIFRPAGIRASYDPRYFLEGSVAQGYVSQKWLDPRDFADLAKGPFWALWGSGGLYLSANDFAKLFTAFLSGKIVSPELVKLSFEPIAYESKSYALGVGWAIYTTQRSTPVIAHNGRSLHSVAHFLYYPEANLFSMGLSNSRSPGAIRVARELAHRIVSEDVPPQPLPAMVGEPASPRERALLDQFVDALVTTVPERKKFVNENMTARKLKEGDEVRSTIAGYARRMGRPEFVDLRSDKGKLVALMRNLEGEQPSLLILTLHIVEQDGRLLIDDFHAAGVPRTDL